MSVLEQVRSYIQSKFLQYVVRLNKRDAAVATVVGLTGGTFPIPIVSVPVTMGLAKASSFSTEQHAVSVVLSILSMPLSLLLIPIFARIASILLRRDPASITREAIKTLEHAKLKNYIRSSGKMMAYATLGWAVVACPIMVLFKIIQETVHDKKEDE